MEIALIHGNQRRRRVAQTFPYACAFNNAEAHARALSPRIATTANIEIPRLFSRPRKYACTVSAARFSLPLLRPDFAVNWQ